MQQESGDGMIEMVDRAAKAVAEVPQYFIRRNKMQPFLQWEVGYVDADEPISDDTIHIVAVFPTFQSAGERRIKEQRVAIARAVIQAIRARV